ncbi:MAG: thioether cross-link-forming SCIFF peptide maturase [Firmicutes bacterium]|nr:thioether cross-link-forming SCIFF peptide maturase [Bacillota bacterium]
MISVHRFCQGGMYFAVDGGSAAIHELDEIAYDVLGDVLEMTGSQIDGGEGEDSSQSAANILRTWRDGVGDSSDGGQRVAYTRLFAKHGAKAVREAAGDLLDLMDIGLLFHDDAYVDELADGLQHKVSLKAICLNVSHDCNLRCRYCFAGTGNFGGERLNMPLDIAQQAIDFLLANSSGKDRVEVDFFGGEPLLNLPVVKETVAYGESRADAMGKEIRFTLTTNGLLLDEETARYLDETMFNLVLSLDGRQSINDHVRVSARGKGVYEVIVPRLKQMVELREERQYYVRGTYTAYNKDFFADVKHLVEIGFDRVSVEPVVADPKEPYSLSIDDLPILFEQYDELAEYYCSMHDMGRGFEFYHFNLSLLEGQCLAKRLTGCGAGTEYLAITPNGDIYPCHQFVGRHGYTMGNIQDPDLDASIQSLFQESNVLNKATCRGCWARFFCSGGCHANAVSVNGDIREPDSLSCALLKKRLECSIYIQARLSSS